MFLHIYFISGASSMDIGQTHVSFCSNVPASFAAGYRALGMSDCHVTAFLFHGHQEDILAEILQFDVAIYHFSFTEYHWLLLVRVG